MSITSERVGVGLKYEEIQLRITVGPEEVEAAFKDARDYLRKRADFKVPGFRNDKIPDKIIDDRHGDKVAAMVKSSIYTSSLVTVIEREGLKVITPADKMQIQLITRNIVIGEPVIYMVKFEAIIEEKVAEAPKCEGPIGPENSGYDGPPPDPGFTPKEA